MPFPWLALAIGTSTAVSYMGSLAHAKQLKNISTQNESQKKG